MRSNQEYKDAALSRIRGNWSPVVLATIVYVVISIIISGGTELISIMDPASFSLWGVGSSFVLSIFIVGPMVMGYYNACRVLYEAGDTDMLRNIWKFATSNYLHKVAGYFFMMLKVALWTCLLIIPGIVMAFAYSMTPYILEENPELSAWEASTRSREMMKGHKFDFFWLQLSFIGWALLSIVTLGIGFFWLAPYINTSFAAFYNDLKGGDGNPTIVLG